MGIKICPHLTKMEVDHLLDFYEKHESSLPICDWKHETKRNNLASLQFSEVVCWIHNWMRSKGKRIK